MKFISKRLLSLKAVLTSIGLIALLVLSSMIIFEATKATVVFAKNGEEETVKTHAKTVEELLDELDIEVGEHDSVSVQMDENIKNGLTIEYNEAKQVYVTIDGNKKEHYTTEKTVKDFLEEENLKIRDRDEMSHNLDQNVFQGIHIVIQKAFEVVIDDGGDETKVWSTGSSVENILKKHDIELDELDNVKPALDEKISEEQLVSITRVEKETETIEESVAYETETKNDSSLKKGKQKVVTQGKKGTLAKKFEIIYENGEEKERELVEEEVVQQPVNQVVAVGTKVEQPKQNLTTLSKSSSGDQPSGKEHHMTATAYTINCHGCNGNGYTATGINLKENPNVIAVDPKVIPLGSKVWVEGYGYAVAGDTGGAIKGNRIDVHVSSSSEAHRFGFKKVKVIVVD